MYMNRIVPAILPKNRAHLAERLAKLAQVPEITDVQIDVVDGRFASPATWPYIVEDGRAECNAMISACEHIPEAGRFRFDLDLMVLSPEEVVGEWIALGASRLTVHVESTLDVGKLIRVLHDEYGYDKNLPDLLSLGLALNVETDPAVIEPYLDYIHYVQFMGIKTIGKQGEPFDRRVLENIRAFRKRHPFMPVQVDGGVTLQTAPALLDVGVSRLVIGHSLGEAAHIQEAYNAFHVLTKQHHAYE